MFLTAAFAFVSKFFTSIFGFVLKNPLVALIVALVVGWGVTYWLLHTEKVHHAEEVAAVQADYAKYREQVTLNAARATKEQNERDQQAQAAARKTDEENKARLQQAEADRVRLAASNDGLRKQLGVYSTKLAAEAARGDVARLAARAATAGKLLEACTSEYGKLAQRAEQTRIQALGLYGYIRDNAACSTPIGPAAP